MAEEVMIDELSIAVEKSATDASKSLRSLANALGKMRSELAQLNITSGQIEQIQNLTNALKPLQSLPKSNLSSYVNSLKKIPDVLSGLDKIDFDEFALKIQKVADTMRPLADEMQKVANGFSAMPTKIQKFITQSEKMNSSAKSGTTAFKKFFNTLINGSNKSTSAFKRLAITGAAGIGLKKLVSKGYSDVKNLMEYIENLNLFYVSMGKYGEQAYEYAQEIGGTMGIDVSEWTRYQAVIMDMSKSFGVTSDTAYTMSKALTQLTYDFSSLYNLKIDEAATKVQSAIAGEIEPIRRLGKDLSVAKLQLTATELGINSNVEAMTQAEKAMLRTITLLRQSSSAQGDLARTLDQPANQMRILKAQLNELARALGEVFLPLLQKALPYVIATVKVLRLAIHEFAKFAGFKLPEFEFTTTEDSINNVNDSLDDTIEKVEKLNQLSFDQLNIIGTPSSTTGTGSSADIAELTEELERLAKIEYEAFSKEITSRADEITAALTDWITQGKGISVWAKDIRDKMLGVKDTVVLIGDALGIWDIPEKIWNILKSMSLDVSKVGINFGDSELDGVTGDDNLRDVLGNALGIALLAGAGLKLLSGGAAGVISYGLGIGLGITAIKMMFDDAKGTGDISEENGIYREVKKILELSLLGSALTLMRGKGLRFSLSMGLSIAALTLGFDGITGFYDDSPENNLASVVKTGIAAALGGVALMVQYGTKSLKYTLPIALAFESISLIYAATEAISDGNVLLGLVTDAVAIGFAGAAGGAIAKFLGASTITGVGVGLMFAIPFVLKLTLERTDIVAKAEKAFGRPVYTEGSWVDTAMSIANNAGEYVADLVGLNGEDTKVDTQKQLAKDIVKNQNINDASNYKYSVSKALDEQIEKVSGETDSDIIYKTSELGKNLNKKIQSDIIDSIEKKLVANGLPAYASGGIVEDGMFYANSGELVGRFSNGRTAVANNAIITEGIERAVYRAMMQSRRSNGGKTYIVLDGQVVGKVFGDAIDNERRRSGVEIQVGGGR